MNWHRHLYLLLCAIVGMSCAADGGPSGTGISSSSASISGNVVAVQTVSATARTTADVTALPPIQVSIDGLPNATTMADSGGNFALNGNFAGALTLRFTVPQFQVTQGLDVPAGSAVVLQNIELQPGDVVAQAARQLNFFGVVDVVECPSGSGGMLQMHDRRSDDAAFLVELNDQTSYVDAMGQPQSCAAISVGSAVAIDGSLTYSANQQTLTALVITIAPSPPVSPPQQIETRFAGALAAVDCTADVLVVDDSVERTTIQLTTQTQIGGAAGASRCLDLQVGDAVHGRGLIDLSAPGVIVATQLIVTGSPGSGETLRLHGFVLATDCSAGTLQLRDMGTIIDVQLAPATTITGRGGQALTCAGIQPGDRIEGIGRVVAGSATINALQLMVSGSWAGGGMGPGHGPG